MTNFPTSSMKISLIGAGNLATHLAIALTKAGHQVVGICSKSGSTAQNLVEKLGQGSQATTQVSDLPKAEIYILATKDDAIAQIIKKWPSHHREGIIVHTSGSVDMDVLSSAQMPHGVLYPLQTFSKDRALDFRKVPCFVEGENAEVTAKLTTFAKSISHNVHTLSSEQRKKLHLSAVFACNFVNHLYDIAGQQLEQQGLPAEWLQPLIEETAEKIKTLPARDAQTGPAIRGDERVLNTQCELLAEHPLHLQLYNLLSKSIYQTFNND